MDSSLKIIEEFFHLTTFVRILPCKAIPPLKKRGNFLNGGMIGTKLREPLHRCTNLCCRYLMASITTNMPTTNFGLEAKTFAWRMRS